MLRGMGQAENRQDKHCAMAWGQGCSPPPEPGVWALLEQPGGASSEPGPIPSPGTAGGAGGAPCCLQWDCPAVVLGKPDLLGWDQRDARPPMVRACP